MPRRLVVRRDHAGALVLRILSEAFEKVEDPAETVEKTLGREGLRLPERTLTIFKAPGDLETGDEELFFSEGWLGTPSWGDALLREPEDPRPSDDRNFDAKVVAFWGLKGGVGRSTALAHVAAMARQRCVSSISMLLHLRLKSSAKAGGSLPCRPQFTTAACPSAGWLGRLPQSTSTA
ncbi:MAG: ParA family protein [Thermoanaerobaculia bacterium]|nr:ParA family protein [Thermoanaerobaculia bacterium]